MSWESWDVMSIEWIVHLIYEGGKVRIEKILFAEELIKLA